MKKAVKIKVEYMVTLEIDTENPIVQEYQSEGELLDDLVHYRFSEVLPVLQEKGVIVKELEVEGWIDVID